MKHRHQSNEQEKEKIEKKQVKEFLVNAGIQFASLEAKKEDPPDLIMLTPERKTIGIEHTRIFRPGEDQNVVWDEPSKRWSEAVRAEDLSTAIESKNRRLVELGWNEEYNEAWLVLIVEGEQWSAFSSYKPADYKVNKHWRFDRIFIYGMFAGDWETIK